LETSLHRALKERYGLATGGRIEVNLHGFRVDALAGDGTVVEIQSGALGPLRRKLTALLDRSRVCVVKPVVIGRRIVRRTRLHGRDLGARCSPKRGAMIDLFDDLVGLAALFPHPHLRLDVLAVEIDEVRLKRKKWPGYVVGDRLLRNVVDRVSMSDPADLWRLLPESLGQAPFSTREVAACLARPIEFAQRVAYCLRLSGAVETIGKAGNRRLYIRSDRGSDRGMPHECA
jgi:hypothetical protein